MNVVVVGRRSPRTSKRPSRLSESQHSRAFWRWLLRTPFAVVSALSGFAIAFGALGLVVYGTFHDPGRADLPQLLGLSSLALWLLARLVSRLRRSAMDDGRSAALEDLELGTLFVAGAFVLIEMTGGATGLLYPLVFALVAFLIAFHSIPQNIYFLTVILSVEAAVTYLRPVGEDPWRLYISHASFLLLFGYLYALFLRSEVAHRRLVLQREIRTNLTRIEEEAREFRLTSGLGLESRELSAEEIAHRRQIGSIQAIHDSLYNVLAVAEKALTPYTVALLWLDASDTHVRVKELRSHSDVIKESRIGVGEGFLGAISKRREPLVLTQLKAGHSGLVYYSRPEPVTDFAGVPVMEGQHLRGILVADRIDGDAFNDDDLSVMKTIAEEVIRAVQVERIFADMDREKYRKERFYQASRDFNTALTVEQVAAVAIDAARRVSQADYAAVAVATERENMLRIMAAHGDTKLVGLELNADSALVGKAIKAQVPLPHGQSRSSQHLVFGPDIPFSPPAVKVLPLLWKEQGVGALVLGSEREDFLADDLLEMLRVVADHAAIAIANAQMYGRMERMATTDGQKI
ncbi:MAG: GAF domain-containing protein, partial [Myxococcota bacterium]